MLLIYIYFFFFFGWKNHFILFQNKQSCIFLVRNLQNSLNVTFAGSVTFLTIVNKFFPYGRLDRHMRFLPFSLGLHLWSYAFFQALTKCSLLCKAFVVPPAVLYSLCSNSLFTGCLLTKLASIWLFIFALNRSGISCRLTKHLAIVYKRERST